MHRTPIRNVFIYSIDCAGEAVVGDEFVPVSLADYKDKYLVLLFFPAAFTFVCPTETIAFANAMDEFKKRDAEVLAVSVDNKHALRQWNIMSRKDGGLGGTKLPLVSDITKKMSEAYGVLAPEDSADAGLSLRGLFIIDKKGIIRHISINDMPVGRNVDETLRLVDAFQFNDENGEVCPHGWKPGAKSM